jgi:hypothetical protein
VDSKPTKRENRVCNWLICIDHENKTNKPPAARPPIVATIQSGTRPASLILTISLKYYLNNETILICLICLVKEIT